MRIRIVFIAGALAFGAGASSQNFKPSKSTQVRLGLEAATEIRKKEKVLPDTDPRVRMLRRIGPRLLAQLNLTKEPWKFTFDVIDSKEVNAFAVPGGPVFFYTGILDKMKTEDEVAGVLGHEITHVTREHWAYATRDSQGKNIGLALGSIFGVNATILQGASLVSQLDDLRYSRAHESQSDDTGFTLMTKAGFNPQGIVDVFRMLQSQGGSRGPEFLSTHPDPGNRVKKLQAKVDALRGVYPPPTPLPFDTSAKSAPVKKSG